MGRVWNAVRRVKEASGPWAQGCAEVFTGLMADLAFVLLSIAVFVVLALVVKGVERL